MISGLQAWPCRMGTEGLHRDHDSVKLETSYVALPWACCRIHVASDDGSICTCGLWTEQSRHYGLGSQYFGRQAAVNGYGYGSPIMGLDQCHTLVVLSGALHTRLSSQSIE